MEPMDERSDDELLAATRSEPEAFAVFYRRHVGPLLGYFARRTRDAELAADLTAETFAPALGGAHRHRPERGPAVAWLYGIARRQLTHAARRGAVEDRARRGSACRRSRSPMRRSSAWRRGRRRRSAAVLHEGLAAMPADQREAVLARVLDEREYADIATRPHVGVRRPQARLARPRRTALPTGGQRVMTDFIADLEAELLAAAHRRAAGRRRSPAPCAPSWSRLRRWPPWSPPSRSPPARPPTSLLPGRRAQGSRSLPPPLPARPASRRSAWRCARRRSSCSRGSPSCAGRGGPRCRRWRPRATSGCPRRGCPSTTSRSTRYGPGRLGVLHRAHQRSARAAALVRPRRRRPSRGRRVPRRRPYRRTDPVPLLHAGGDRRGPRVRAREEATAHG